MYNLYLLGSGLCLPYPTLDTRLSLILRPVSGPSMAGLGVFEGGGSEELDSVLLHAFIFSQPIVRFHLQVVEFCVKLFRALDLLVWTLP